MIIAIDGPAAAGKGTLARGVSEHLNLAYLRYRPTLPRGW